MLSSAELTTDPFYCIRGAPSHALARDRELRTALLNASLPSGYSVRTADATATSGKERDFWKEFKASRASACSLPTKQVFVSEGNMEYQPAPHTTRLAREPPTTTLAGTRSGIAKRYAPQSSQLRKAKDIVSKCSRTRSGHDDDECESHLEHALSNDGGS